MMKIKLSNLSKRWSFVLSVMFFRIALDCCYWFFVAPTFQDHFLLPLNSDFYFWQYLVSLLLVAVVAILVPYGKNDLSGLLFFVILMFVYIPLTVVYGLDSGRPIFPVIATLVAIIITMLASSAENSKITFPIVRGGESVAIIISIVFVIVFLLWTIVSGAFRDFNLDPGAIYEFRRDQSSLLDSGGMAYVNLWTQKVFALFLLSIAIYYKKWILLVIMTLSFVYFFGVTSNRLHLFTPILAGFIWYLYNGRTTLQVGYLMAGASLLVVLFVTLALDLEIVGSIILRRAFFVPASATFEWFNFFSIRPHVYWSDNLLSFLIRTDYSGVSIPFIIGDELAADKDVSFNNGLVSSGFAHAGMIGVIFYSAIIGIILRLANSIIRTGVPVWIAAALFVGPIRTAWADSDLFAALLTHGIIISLFLLWLYGRPSEKGHSVKRSLKVNGAFKRIAL